MNLRKSMFGLPWGAMAPLSRGGVAMLERGGPAPRPGVPGGCSFPLSALSEAHEYLVLGLANPFALRWVPIDTVVGITGIGPGGTAGEIFALGRQVPILNNSNELHPGDGGAKTENVGRWHHISISVEGEVIFPSAAPVDNPERIPGNHATILKARIKLMMANSRTRTFDIDIGAGVEIDVKCRAVVSITALVPDPSSIPDAIPDGLVPTLTFAVSIVTCITCAAVPQGYKMPVTYSQVFWLGVDDVNSAFMPIVSDAREIELFISSTIAPIAPAVSPAGSVVGDFVYVPTSQLIPSLTLPAAFAPMGEITSAPGQGQTLRSIIPGNVNGIIVANGVGTPSAVNVVQILNV